MQYKLKSEEGNQLIFKESSAISWLIWLFPIIGFPIFLLGLLGTLGSLAQNTPIESMELIMMGFGFTFTAAVGIMWISRNGNPNKITFDNNNGVVRINQKRKGGEAYTEIPYEEIDGFYIRKHSSTSSSSSGTSTTTRNIVYWMKKDGSVWDLTYYGNRSKAEAFQHKITQFVQLNTPSNFSKEAKLPTAISLKKSTTSVALEWQNKISAKLISFLLVILGFCIVDAGLFLKWQEGEGGAPFFIMTIFMSVIVGLIVYFILKNLTTIYRLVITEQEIYFEHIKEGQSTKKKSMQLDQIAAISFDFKDVVGGSPLRILNHKELSQLQEAMTGTFNFSDIGQLVSMAFKTFQINIDALDVVDKVDLERILQKVILEKGGINVL